MKPGRAIQWVIFAVLWVAILAIILLTSVIAAIFSLPVTSFVVLITGAIGIIVSRLIFPEEFFNRINPEIESEFSRLSDAEILKIMNAMDELHENTGISIELPIKSKKAKRDVVDSAIRNLSDTELLHLKEQLRDGNIDEDQLIAWLDSQRESQKGEM